MMRTLAAKFAPEDANRPADERDTQIDLKATRIAFYVLRMGGVLVAAGGASMAGGRLHVLFY